MFLQTKPDQIWYFCLPKRRLFLAKVRSAVLLSCFLYKKSFIAPFWTILGLCCSSVLFSWLTKPQTLSKYRDRDGRQGRSIETTTAGSIQRGLVCSKNTKEISTNHGPLKSKLYISTIISKILVDILHKMYQHYLCLFSYI